MPFQHHRTDLHGRQCEAVARVQPGDDAVIREPQRQVVMHAPTRQGIDSSPGKGAGGRIFEEGTKQNVTPRVSLQGKPRLAEHVWRVSSPRSSCGRRFDGRGLTGRADGDRYESEDVLVSTTGTCNS